MSEFLQLPPQQLPYKKKNKKWRKQVLDWGASRATINNSLIRKTVIHKKINYDLYNGILHINDMMNIINPYNTHSDSIPDKIQHYAILNSKLDVLVGEESKRLFDYRVIVTNPNSISEIEKEKDAAIMQDIQQLIESQVDSEEEFNKRLNQLDDFYTYNWQSKREIIGNCFLKQYSKEYNMPMIFNNGFVDALICGEEMYICDIVGGEPTIERLNPNNVRIYKSSNSSKIEDADIIVIEDYWSPGKIIDTYYDVLTQKDREYIEKLPDILGQGSKDKMDNVLPNNEFIRLDDSSAGDAVFSEGFFWSPTGNADINGNSMLPYDLDGNIRVVRMFWKSKRKIKKVKYFDENGEEQFEIYPESYVINEALGEEEEILYINQAWEGVKIGEEIYVNMRPRIIQYNRLSNPSRCHFGIIGTIYNTNEGKPLSLVDKLKPFNYLYDVIHDRLNKLIAKNWGKIISLDLSKVPEGWTVNKWLYFATRNNLAVTDSFKEGNKGAATGKLAGALNNASNGVIDAELGNSIQQYINILEFIKMEMSDVSGISKQREGNISNRETVGGVERATLQSSYITEYLFNKHEDVKKRVLECFLETAKIAYKGRKKKFQYILPDGAAEVLELDGDDFSENDYGLVVDNSNQLQELNQKLDTLAQAALQNQILDFSTVMKLYNSASIAEKERMVEKAEQRMQQRQEEQQQQQQQMQQEQIQAQQQQAQQQMEFEEKMNKENNETKILVAQIAAQARTDNSDGIEEPIFSEEAKANLQEKMREFDEKLKLDRDKLSLDREKMNKDHKAKMASINKKPVTSK